MVSYYNNATKSFETRMLEISELSIISEEVRKPLDDFLTCINSNGFMHNLRSQKLPDIDLQPDNRGGLVAVARNPIKKGSLVFFTDGPVLVGNLDKVQDTRYIRGGINANLELKVKSKNSRKITSVHQLFNSNVGYYADNACENRGNLTFVNTSLASNKSMISISSFYAQKHIKKGERLSFQYYYTLKRGSKKNGYIQCDCHQRCKNMLLAMSVE